jgi:hypothetical protein
MTEYKLPQITNEPIEISIGDVKLMAKRATLKDFARLQEYVSKLQEAKDKSADLKAMIYALKLCVEKAYSEPVSEDYLMELLPLSFAVKNTAEMRVVLEKLGFIIPQETEKK